MSTSTADTASLPRFADVTLLPNDKLSTWLNTLEYSCVVLQQLIDRLHGMELYAAYEQRMLDELRDMTMFVGMARDTYYRSIGLDALCAAAPAADATPASTVGVEA